MTTEDPPPCLYGQWRGAPHTAVDPVEITRVRGPDRPDDPAYACPDCIPSPELPGA